MKRCGKYTRPRLGALILGPLLILTEVAGEIILPELMSMAINNGVAQGSVQYILSVRGLAILVALVTTMGGIRGAYFSVKAATSFISDLRADLFSEVQEFSFKDIDAYNTGLLIICLTNGIQQIQNVLIMGLWMATRALGMFVGALFMVFMTSAKLVVIILVVIPLLVTAITVILKIAFPKFTAVQKKLDQLNSGIREAPTNVRVTESFVWEEFEEDRSRITNQDLKNGSLGAMKIVIVAMPVMTLAMNITTLAAVWYGGNIIIAGDMPAGDLIAFTTCIVQILISLMMLPMVFLQLSRAVISIRRVSKVMDTEIGLTDQETARKDLVILAGKMGFKHVSLSYTDNQDETVLEDISSTAEPGWVIGITGATGSGKTTLVQMIPRPYDAVRSQVLVDGTDVRDYPPKNLRESMGMVPQRNMPLSGTIEENLRRGKGNASMGEIRGVAQSAQADSFVTFFVNGYDTDMGQGGINVSGGQKQGPCIARTLLERPKILILDNSASAVDIAAGARIRQCFSTSLKDTAKIIIAQCTGSVEGADRILVLDEGRLIGQGTHKQLMEECQAYQEIYCSRRNRRGTAAS